MKFHFHRTKLNKHLSSHIVTMNTIYTKNKTNAPVHFMLWHRICETLIAIHVFLCRILVAD